VLKLKCVSFQGLDELIRLLSQVLEYDLSLIILILDLDKFLLKYPINWLDSRHASSQISLFEWVILLTEEVPVRSFIIISTQYLFLVLDLCLPFLWLWTHKPLLFIFECLNNVIFNWCLILIVVYNLGRFLLSNLKGSVLWDKLFYFNLLRTA
jgi:hypothetical protein